MQQKVRFVTPLLLLLDLPERPDHEAAFQSVLHHWGCADGQLPFHNQGRIVRGWDVWGSAGLAPGGKTERRELVQMSIINVLFDWTLWHYISGFSFQASFDVSNDAKEKVKEAIEKGCDYSTYAPGIDIITSPLYDHSHITATWTPVRKPLFHSPLEVIRYSLFHLSLLSLVLKHPPALAMLLQLTEHLSGSRTSQTAWRTLHTMLMTSSRLPYPRRSNSTTPPHIMTPELKLMLQSKSLECRLCLCYMIIHGWCPH